MPGAHGSIALTSSALGDKYSDLVAKGYRWAIADGLYACQNARSRACKGALRGSSRSSRTRGQAPHGGPSPSIPGCYGDGKDEKRDLHVAEEEALQEERPAERHRDGKHCKAVALNPRERLRRLRFAPHRACLASRRARFIPHQSQRRPVRSASFALPSNHHPALTYRSRAVLNCGSLGDL